MLSVKNWLRFIVNKNIKKKKSTILLSDNVSELFSTVEKRNSSIRFLIKMRDNSIDYYKRGYWRENGIDRLDDKFSKN